MHIATSKEFDKQLYINLIPFPLLTPTWFPQLRICSQCSIVLFMQEVKGGDRQAGNRHQRHILHPHDNSNSNNKRNRHGNRVPDWGRDGATIRQTDRRTDSQADRQWRQQRHHRHPRCHPRLLWLLMLHWRHTAIKRRARLIVAAVVPAVIVFAVTGVLPLRQMKHWNQRCCRQQDDASSSTSESESESKSASPSSSLPAATILLTIRERETRIRERARLRLGAAGVEERTGKQPEVEESRVVPI